MSAQNQQTTISGETPSHGLWNKALDTLGVELRNSLDLTKASRGNILSKALKEAREKKQICVQKCWTLKKHNGETIILRDVVEKIIVWVEKFIAVGDAAMQYDPVHAAPAWGAFRFVLQMAVNYKTAFGEMIENLEAVSHLITRYAILEELYLQRSSAARDKLEDMVVRLYAEILTFLARARKYFQSSAKFRLATSIVKSSDEHMTKINVLDGQISSLTEVFTVDIQTDTAKSVAAMNALLMSLNDPIKRLVDHSSISAQVLQERQHLQLLRWLSPVPFSSHHMRLSESRIPGSGQWLLDHNRYLVWRNTSSSSIFLLHGIIGSGKTSLAAAVVDSFLQESSGQNSPAPIAYFYCTKNSAEAERSNPDEIMRSILRQLTVSHGPSSTIHERVLQEYERREAVAKVDGFGVTRLRAAECVRLILDTTAANPATIVLDAVDEIPSSSRHVLLSALVQIVQDSLSVVKVFLTSRDDSNIHALLSDAVAVRIQNEYTRKDMDKFVRHMLSSAIQDRKILNGVISDNLRQDLISALTAGAGEMFVWAVRQIENLCRMKTEADIRSAMRALPKSTLYELYEEDFTQISKSGEYTRSYAKQVFSMLLCTQEPLSPQALIQSMAKTVSQQGEIVTLAALIDICFNLVVLDSELNVLRFAHISFQEFLETRAEFAPQYVHREAAISCLELCLEGLPTEMETDLSPKDNFYHYSAVYWAEHCRITIVNGADDSMTSRIQEFVFDGSDVALSFVDWIQEVSKFTKRLPNDHAMAKRLYSVINSSDSPLFTACVFGLAPIIDDLVHIKDYDWNQTNDLGQGGLYLAAAAGNRTIVQILLEREVHVNTLGGKFGHPLHAACFGGHASIAKLLLGHGADPKLGPRSALDYALLGDHENIALLLLDGKFDISDQTEYDSILQQVAEAGFSDVVQFLQKEYALLYGGRGLGSSRCRAVEVAIFKGRTQVVYRYMQKLSDPRIEMPEGAIAIAALGGQDAMISLLVDQGLDLNEEGVLGTPIRGASIMSYESTVKLLLRLGANLHVSGSLGEPLQAAAMRGHESITRTLLIHGADVNSMGGLYGTALQAAAHRGHQKVVEILLDAGADVHRDGFSRDAFHAASEGGHEGVVRLLLERGFKLQHTLERAMMFRSGRRCPYRNLLREASPSRPREAKLTWDHESRSKDWRERASVIDFSHASDRIRGAVTSELELIQPYGEQLRYQGRIKDAYALRVAAAKGHVTVVELLLSQADKLNFPKSEIVAAFKEACENGHEKVVNQLLSDQVEVKDLKAALETAALKGHLTVVNLLIDHEDRLGLARVETVCISCPAAKDSSLDSRSAFESPIQGTYEYDSTARAILNSGSKGGHMPIFRRGQELVAQRCIDVTSRHFYGEALNTAARNCKFDVMEALLESNFEFELVVDSATVIDVSGNGFMDILPPLVEKIRPTDSFAKTLDQCLQVASKMGHKEIVEYLIGEGVDVNTLIEDVRYKTVGYNLNNPDTRFYDNRSITPKISALHAALIGFERFGSNSRFRSSWTGADASSQQRSIEIILAKGADPNGADGYKRYPLNMAAEYCTVEIVQELISSGAHVEAATKEHGTALQAAARREIDGLPIVKTLLEANVPVSSNNLGKTAALSEALSFFATSAWNKNGRFINSTSITDVLSTGPGAVVKILLANLPEEKADDSRFRLLVQMACVVGDRECVEILLQRGMDVNDTGNYYGTALQAASRVGNIEIVEGLLNSGADANILQGIHGTALRAATLGNHEDIVRSLIARGADVNIQYKDRGESILHLALESRNRAIFKALLIAGADMNTEISNQQHILVAACKHGDMSLVELLLTSGVDVNVSGRIPRHYSEIPYGGATPLNAACAEGHLSIVRLLLDNGADIEKTNGSSATPLIAAIRGNNPSVTRLLLDAGANVNHAVHVTPLLEAVEDCKLEIVIELLSAGAIIGGPSTKSNALAESYKRRQHVVIELLLNALSGTQHETEICGEALSAAITVSDNEMVHLLLEDGVSPSFEMLCQACSAGVLEVVRMLVDTGIDVNENDGHDALLLHVAASHSKPDIVQFLINRGADVMLRTKKYGSPLIAALEGSIAPFLRGPSQTESCQSLAKQLPLPEPLHDSDPRGHRESQQKPGYKEVLQCEQIVGSLFDAGAEVDTTIRNFGNSLHIASYMGSEVIVRQLLERMENISIFGGYFGSPLIAALKGDHPIITELLLNRGIEVNHSSPNLGFALHHACAHRDKKLVQNLLEHGADINTYDEKHGSALAAAASPGDTRPEEQRAVVEFLLRYEIKVQIRECDLLAAASRRYRSDGQHFIGLFLKHDQSAVVTERVIVKTIENAWFLGSPETLPLLLEHDGGLGTTPAMLKAARNIEVMKMLLKHKPMCQVTADVLESAAVNAPKLVKLLLTHDPKVPITGATIIAA